ncbi:MAG: single-stranded DNA-binding protein [Brumimicrobium sp.]
MATVFETRLIGNIGKDAIIKKMDRGVLAINFPVAHNRNWKDRKTGENKTKTIWVNCTIWKREDGNLRLLDFLKSGTLVELIGIPYTKAYQNEDGVIKSEIRLNVSKTNILRTGKNDDSSKDKELDDGYENFTIDEDDF